MHCTNVLLTDLYKSAFKSIEYFPKNEKTVNNSLLDTAGFHALINYISREVITFGRTSQVFYFYMKIFDTGTNFDKPEQKHVKYTYLFGIKSETIIISKTPLNGALRKIEITKRLFLQVILTSNNEKNLSLQLPR